MEVFEGFAKIYLRLVFQIDRGSTIKRILIFSCRSISSSGRSSN